jgi:hypothetical protein
MRVLYLAATAALALSAVPTTAMTTVLDFSGDICGMLGNEPCENGVRIAQYGSTANVAVTWSTRSIAGNGEVVENSVVYWETGYADLVGSVYAIGSVGEARLVVAPGFTLTLDSVKVGGYPNSDRTSEIRVYDLDYDLLMIQPMTFPGESALTVALGQSSTTGLVFQWGPDAVFGGIDDLTFTVRPNQVGPGPIPEPATWAMLIAGFGLTGAALRRRRVVPA